MPELLHNLMHSQAALQCYFNQDSFNIQIPVYLKNSAEKFDQSKLTGFLVQVKNKSEVTKFIVCDSDITDFYGKNFDIPTIFTYPISVFKNQLSRESRHPPIPTDYIPAEMGLSVF